MKAKSLNSIEMARVGKYEPREMVATGCLTDLSQICYTGCPPTKFAQPSTMILVKYVVPPQSLWIILRLLQFNIKGPVLFYKRL